MGTGREGQVYQLAVLGFSLKALWLEGFGIVPELRVTVHKKRTDKNVGISRHFIAAQHIGFDGATRDDPHRRVQAQGLAQHVMRVVQGFHVLQRGLGFVGQCVEFGVQFGLDLRMIGEQKPGPVEHAGGGLMAGDDQRGDLIDDLAVAHALTAVFVARLQQHRHVVGVATGGLAAVGAAPRHAAADQRGEFAKAIGKADVSLALFGEAGKRVVAGLGGHGIEVSAEDHAQDDLQGHLAHVVGDVDRLVARGLFVPTGQTSGIGACDDARQLCQHAAMKGGLHHATLALPELTFAHYDAVAQQHLDAVKTHTLGIVAMVRDQDAAHIIGVVKHPGVRVPARCIHAVGITQLRVDAAHAIERVGGGAHVELLVGLGRQRRGIRRVHGQTMCIIANILTQAPLRGRAVCRD